ncbi:MAG: amino acid decarboxylase [Peptococcaceae bacterium]|nr:amino acid decarboxylase [Peptococcaceae bacterium]
MDLLGQKLSEYVLKNMCSFHTPGHKGRKDLLASLIFPDFDLTELPELDMLHNPQGVIAEAQMRAAFIYGAEDTFFLVNGATSGNQAMFMALMSGLNGKKVRVERRAHQSVFGGFVLSGLSPDYVPPLIHPDFRLPLGLNVEHFTEKIEDIGAIHITSPSYYGTVVDLESIIRFRDREVPSIPILVDQAHGSHYHGALFPANAVRQGADLVVHSTHKTLSALTQAGMLHIKGERVDKLALKKSLEILLTSSPNYLLMASLEKALADLESPWLWDDLHDEVIHLHEELDGYLRILTAKDAGKYGIYQVDWSKILINTSSLEIGAAEVVEILRNSFGIEPELWDHENILFLLGSGNRPEDIRKLREALKALVKKYLQKSHLKRTIKNNHPPDMNHVDLPPMHLTPREAWLAPKRIIKLSDALGKISGETISVYPPGIPIVAAGEEITPYVMNYLNKAEDYNWQGWQGFRQGQISVINQ